MSLLLTVGREKLWGWRAMWGGAMVQPRLRGTVAKTPVITEGDLRVDGGGRGV